jgi:hypothetical protein
MYLLLFPPLLFIFVGVAMTLGYVTAKIKAKGDYDKLRGLWIIWTIIYGLGLLFLISAWL